MQKNNFFISFGIWLMILPFFGIPGTWRNALVSLSGLFLLSIFVIPMILGSLQAKPKQKLKKKVGVVMPENVIKSETEHEKTD